MRGLSLIAAVLLASCASNAVQAPAPQSATQSTSPQYLLVYTLDNKHFLFAGRPYDDASIAPAITAAGAAGVVHVIVLRDGGKGLTISALLAVVPALSNGKSCLFFQDAGSIKSASMNGKDGKPVDQSFCPTFEDVAAGVGLYAPPPQ